MITIKVEGIDDLYAMFDDSVIRGATYRAVNRTVDGFVTDISKEVRQTYNIKKSDIDKRLRKIKATDYNNPVGYIDIIDKAEGRSALPLIMFNAVGRTNLSGGGAVKTMKGRNGYYSKKLNRAGKSGVTYKVLKAGGVGQSKNAFIMPGGNGSLQVVYRKHGMKGRNTGLVEKRVMSPVEMVQSMKHNVMDRILKQGNDRLRKNLLHELDFYQKRFDAGYKIGNLGRGRR